MALGRNVFCHGVEPYNFRDTEDTVATITANVGQSTAIGPKVAISRNKPFPEKKDIVAIDMGGGKSSSNITTNLSPTITCTHGGEPVIGTIDASIYRKNNFQDNTKYIVRTNMKGKKNENNTKILKKAIEEGKDIVSILNNTEVLLKVVGEGIMTLEEAIVAIDDIRETIGGKGADKKQYVEKAIKKVREMNQEYSKSLPKDEETADSQKPLEEEATEDLVQCIVRKLCPTETSRLQAFPDDYTKIDGEGTADAPQYKAHGNSWATQCAYFFSTRIEMELRRLGYQGSIHYATCCSGIEAHSVAVRNLDWKSVFFSEIEPFPCRVLATHYPSTPNLGDMTQIHYDPEKGCITNAHKEGEEYSLPSCFKEAPIQELPFKAGDLEVFSGGTPCFAKGAYVLTKTGYKPIEDVKVGEEVATHAGRFCRVLKIGKKLSSDLVEVGVVGRGRFICTADHPFPLLRSHHRKNGKLYFDNPLLIPIKDGQSLYAQMVNAENESFGVELPQLPKVYRASADEIYELCGWYVGDGYIRGWTGKSKKAIVLCLNAKDIVVFNERFAGKINYSISKSAGIFKVQICCTELARFLHNHFGELAHGKKIPMWVYNKEVKKNFIRGYFQTDGCLTRGGHSIQWSTVSPALAYGIADTIGHTSVNLAVMPKTTTICGRMVNQRDFYTVRHNDASNHFHKVGKFDCVKVREVKRLKGKTDWVYNLEVEDDHTYIVNGLVTHNCQSISIAGKREGMAEGSGTRSSLAFHYQRIIDELRPTFTLWENVPGAFSSNGGADFIWFVNRCAESGYAMAWRVVDAQYVMTEEYPRAVPQRRRRIWMVGFRENDWREPARIVFELKKDLTANPPTRVPGLGFKELTEEGRKMMESQGEATTTSTKSNSQLGLAMEGGNESRELLKVSKLIDFSDMPDESDFSKVSIADIFEFARKVGEPGYIGNVFRTDKKKKKAKKVDDSFDLFSMMNGEAPKEEVKEEKDQEADEEWQGAERITPAILENIGNAGILANGRICTINCNEWTGGIQLSSKTFSAWEEAVKHKDWLKANDLLPEAYDETVCGLSDVLEEDPGEKYDLSWRACFGILRRAETRAKELPAALEVALISTIQGYASIVKWYALYGKETKKKETDLSEKESARICFAKYIAPIRKFEDVEPVQPQKRNSDVDDDEEIDEDVDIDEDGNITMATNKEEKETAPKKLKACDIPNGVMNLSGGEVSPTIVSSQFKGPGNTQDGTIEAVKQDGAR